MNTTTVTNATEYRDLPLAMLTESTTNSRRIFEENALKELAETIRSQGVLSPLLVRPTSERSFEIVFGARRYRAAQLAEVATVPVRIKNLTDAEVLEAQLIENLQRRDVHPMEEATASAPSSIWRNRSTASNRLPRRPARVRYMWPRGCA
jgi:ParB family chromosome partitioning protein